MEETESADCEAAEETQPTDVGEVLQKAGLDRRFWSKVLKDEQGVEYSEQLQYLLASDYEVIKRHVRFEWEKRALQKVLENHNGRHEEKKRQEKHKIEQVKKLGDFRKLHLEGRDRNDAKFKKKLDEISSALEVPEGSWLESGKPLQDLIKPLFERLCTIEKGLNPQAGTIPDEEVLRFASGGLALEGIYLTGSLEDLLQKRQRLLEVPESFMLHGPEQKYFYEKKEFNSWQSQAKFQKVMEKLGASFRISCKNSALGIESEVKNENERSKEETKKSTAENTSIIATQYNYVPLASCLIEKDKLMLCDSALNELKKLESILRNVNEKKNPELLKEVDRFFQTFGSHVNQGPLHFGGIFWWTASAEGFSSSDLSEVKSLTSTALNSCVGIGLFFGNSGGISTSLSHCQGSFEGKYSARLLSKLQLSVSKSGGPPETDDHLSWKSGLVTSNKSWCVIDRGDKLVPVWEIIKSSHCQNFRDVSKLSNFMMEAYKEITKQEAGSLWGQNVCSAVRKAQTMIQSVKKWFVSDSEKHLRELLDIKRNLEYTGATKAWVQECLSNRELQDFLTRITIQNTDLNLQVMMKSVMDQSCDVEDFPNRAKILKWTKLSEEDLPEVTSAAEFSDLEKILSEVEDNFRDLHEPGMSPEAVATCKITTAINSLLARLRNKNETDIELLILSIVNALGYREDTFHPPLGLEDIVFLQGTLHQRYGEYVSLKEKSSEKVEAFLLLTGLTVSRDNQRIPPEDKKARMKFLASRAGNICHVSKLIKGTEKVKDWNKLEQELNKIISDTSKTEEQKGLFRKIQILDQFMKPLEWKNDAPQEHTSSRTGTDPLPIDEWKAGKFKGLLQRLGLWE